MEGSILKFMISLHTMMIVLFLRDILLQKGGFPELFLQREFYYERTE